MTAPVTHPFSLTAPASLTLSPDSSGSFAVTNSGTEALKVTDSLGRFTVNSLHYPAASGATLTQLGTPWVSISPAGTFILEAGQTKVIRISDHVPAGAGGMHYINVLWRAVPARAEAGNLHLAGAVASTVKIPLPGVAVPVGPGHGLPHAMPVPHGGGFPAVALAVPMVAVAGVAAVAAVVARQRRRTRRAAA